MSSTNCNNKCNIIPLTVKSPQSARFSDQLKRNTMRTIYQGQPSNIIITRILSDSAVIEFTQIGYPTKCLFELSSGGFISNTYTVDAGLTKFQATGLMPGTLYEINLYLTYVSGDQFAVNHKKTFLTLNKWKVPSVSYMYPTNKIVDVSQNFGYTAIDLSFDLSPGKPTRYIIQVDVSEIHVLNNFYLKPKLYPIYIRNQSVNESGSVVKIITEYLNDPGYNDVSFTYEKSFQPFFEGTSSINSITEGANFISMSFSKAPGNPMYNFYLRKFNDGEYRRIKYQKLEFSDGIVDISLSEFIRDTRYTLNVETYYSQSGNSYRNTNDISFTTLNHSPIQNVQCIASNRSLKFMFESPTGDFSNSSNSYFSIRLKNNNGIDVSSNLHTINNTTQIIYTDLSINAAYTFLVTSYYSNVFFYSYERTDRTLYEEAVQNVLIYNIRGTTVDISYTPYTLPTSYPSIPDYYAIKYVDLSLNTNIVQTYRNNETLTNLLNPDTSYNFSVTSIYSSGQSYEVSGNDTIRTLNEGPVKSISMGTIKGDQVDLSWDIYDRLTTPNRFQIEIYQNISPNKFVDFSYVRIDAGVLYNNRFNTFRLLNYASDYKFTFVSDFSSGNIYKRDFFFTTANEYAVKLSVIFADSTSIEIQKDDITNNQDSYIFVRTPKSTDIDVNTWVEQDVSKNTTELNPTFFAGDNTTFSNIEMSKNGFYVLFCPNRTEIQIYKQFERIQIIESTSASATLTETQYYHSLLLTIYPGKPIFSMSVNYTGSVFIVGFNDNTAYIYDVAYDEANKSLSCTQRTTIDVSGTTSRTVVLSPSGNITAVSNGELRDSIFIMDVLRNKWFSYLIPNLINVNDNWFKTILNKYVQFDNSGSIMAIGVEHVYFPIDGTQSTVKTYVDILDLSFSPFTYIARNIDVSGSRISLNKAGTKIAVVNNYDTSSNSTMYGSVRIYTISSTKSSALTNVKEIWGSENIQYPNFRNCSIDDTGNTVAIGEYNLSYKSGKAIDGQVQVLTLSGSTWSLKGLPIRQTGDVEPIQESDTIQTGEWFGYNLILDGSGNNLLTSTRPKLNINFSIFQGKGYYYKWKNNDSIYKFNILSWPVLVNNLTVNSNYSFRIYASYSIDPGYSYFVDTAASTLTGQKPVVFYSISNDSIGLKWSSVTWDKTMYTTLKYTVLVTQDTSKIVDVSIDARDTPSVYDVSFIISGPAYTLTNNTAYNVTVASEFTRTIQDARNTSNYSTLQFIYKNEQLVRTLNERASDINVNNNIVALNSNNLVVFDIENAGLLSDISQNKVTLTVLSRNNVVVNDMSFSFVVVPPSMLDISQLQIYDQVNYFVETTYKKQPKSGVFTFNNSSYKSNTGTFFVSNASVLLPLIKNGRFSSDTAYSSVLAFQNIKRFPVDIFKGIYKIIPPFWSDKSYYIYTIENQPTPLPPPAPYISSQKLLDVADISYHVILNRSEDVETNLSPANLTQELQGSVFARRYSISFYLRNQGGSSNIYDDTIKTYFSDDVKYQIEFADVLNDNYIFYKTSPIRNSNINWAKFQCRVNFPSSRKKVNYTIRREGKEFNNLFVSDVSMIFTNIKSDPYKLIDGSWNCLSASPTPWKDVWAHDGSFEVIQLSCNMSISFWFYLHCTDVSQCIFLLGSDTDNGTPGIYIDNTNIIVKNVYDDSSYNNLLSTSSVIGVPTHFVITYFNSTISTYKNGIAGQQVDVSKNTIREAHSNYNIYIGNPNNNNFGVVMKSLKIYDYQLDLSFISNSLYNLEKSTYQIGNPNDLSSNKIQYFVNGSTNERQVTLPVLGKPTLYKNVFLNSSFSASDVSSVSMWINALSTFFIDDYRCECTANMFTFRNYQIILKNAVNHFTITNEPHNLKLYMNGYLYLTDISNMTSISGSNLGEVTTWNKVLSESNALTCYYNYYNLYSTYDMSGHYIVFVEYPKGIGRSLNAVVDVSYSVKTNPYTDISGTISLVDGNDISNIVITLDPLSLNSFNKKQDIICVRLSDYDVIHEISAANVPYIQYSYSNIQYLTENTRIDFWLENIPILYYDFSYSISGGITGRDLSNSFDIGGTIRSNRDTKVSIFLKEDYTIEDMEALIFNVPSLNLSTFITIYDRLYFTSSTPNPNKGDVFTISLRNTMTQPDNSFNYKILGVTGEDISGVDLSGTLYNSNISSTSTVDLSLSVYDISFTVTANPTARLNLPFQIMLTNTDYSFVSITVWLNDYFNLSLNKTEIKEGDYFSVTLKMPYYVENGTSFGYIITGISAEDLSSSSIYGGLTGYFVSVNSSATTLFKYKYNALPDQKKTFKITISNEILVNDLSLSTKIIDVEPVLILSGPDEVNEGESFTIFLNDLSQNLQSGTIVKYKLVYVDATTNDIKSIVSSTDVSANTDIFTLVNYSGSVEFTAIADDITDGGKTIQVLLEDFPNIFRNVFVNDTSQFPVYDLSSNKSVVNEGDSFTIRLIYSNIPTGLVEIPFDISGIGTADISGLQSLRGVFTIPNTISRSGEISKTYSVRFDSETEMRERVEFRLTSATNSNVMVAIDISDTSQSPIYRISIAKISDGNPLNSNISNNTTFDLTLSTTNVQNGSMIRFTFDNLSITNLSGSGNNSLNYSNTEKAYSGIFTVGSKDVFRLTSLNNSDSNINSKFSLATLPFKYNGSTDFRYFHDLTLTKQ